MPIDVLQMKKLNNSTTTLKFLSKNLKNVLLYLANRKKQKNSHTKTIRNFEKQIEIVVYHFLTFPSELVFALISLNCVK